LSPASLGVPLPLNPGSHVIAASAPGKETWRTEIVAQRGEAPIVLDIPELAPREAARSAGMLAADDGKARDGSKGTPGATQRAIALIMAGVGIAAAGAGTFFALRASALDDESKAFCDPPNVCFPEGKSRRDDALAAADVSTVSFIAAGVLVAAGAVLFFSAPTSKATARVTSMMRFSGPGGGGGGLQHRF
jgi:hypothetical protein